MAKRKRTSRTTRKRSKASFALSQLQQSQTARIAKRTLLRNTETKRNVAGFNEYLDTDGFSAWDMSVIAQGDEMFERQGRQIVTTSMKKNLWFRNNSFLEPIIVRTLVLQAKDGNTENIASGTDLFNKTLLPDDNRSSWNQHAGQQKLQAILKPIDSTNWIVREDKVFTLGTLPNPNVDTTLIGTATTAASAYHDGRGAIKLARSSLNMKSRKLHYDADGSCENRLHFVVMCCQVDGSQFAGSSMSIVGNLCLYYKDP